MLYEMYNNDVVNSMYFFSVYCICFGRASDFQEVPRFFLLDPEFYYLQMWSGYAMLFSF